MTTGNLVALTHRNWRVLPNNRAGGQAGAVSLLAIETSAKDRVRSELYYTGNARSFNRRIRSKKKVTDGEDTYISQALSTVCGPSFGVAF